MKLIRLALVFLAIGLVVGTIFIVESERSLYVVTSTESFTTTTVITNTSLLTLTSVVNSTRTISILGNVELSGNCTASTYFVPDTIQVTATSTSGTLTVYSTEYQNSTVGTSTFSTSTYVNSTASYIVTTTSYDLNDRPSNGWTVTVCTYEP
jgi:hypothetical protein